ncbi:MAG: hypothetical protein AAGH99_06325 [Planctomycetota bacterium]
MPSKFRLKIGNIEIEYEGSDSYIQKEVPKLLAVIDSLGFTGQQYDESSRKLSEAPQSTASKKGAKLDMSTSTVAKKLDAKSCSGLALAASAKLELIDGKITYSRTDIFTEMKSANAFYKASMSSNLSNSLKTLVKSGALNAQSNDNYSLNSDKKEELEKKLAGK